MILQRDCLGANLNWLEALAGLLTAARDGAPAAPIAKDPCKQL